MAGVNELIQAANAQQSFSGPASAMQKFLQGVRGGTQGDAIGPALKLAQLRQLREKQQRQKEQDAEQAEINKRLDKAEKAGKTVKISSGPSGVTRTLDPSASKTTFNQFVTRQVEAGDITPMEGSRLLGHNVKIPTETPIQKSRRQRAEKTFDIFFNKQQKSPLSRDEQKQFEQVSSFLQIPMTKARVDNPSIFGFDKTQNVPDFGTINKPLKGAKEPPVKPGAHEAIDQILLKSVDSSHFQSANRLFESEDAANQANLPPGSIVGVVVNGKLKKFKVE